MTTREFIKELEDMGCGVKEYDSIIEIFTTNPLNLVGYVQKNVVNNLGISTFDAGIDNKLFDLIIEYTKTPIEDRGKREDYHVSPVTKIKKIMRFMS